MKTFRRYMINEMLDGVYSYSSTQINLPKDLAKEVTSWGKKNLKDEDIYTDPKDSGLGREDEIHATILYGLHTVKTDPVKKALSGEKCFDCTLGKMKKFEGRDGYDVLYIEIKASGLHRLNKTLQKLPFTSNYPKYTPHVTIAYVKKGRADKHLNSEEFAGKKFHIDEIVFSSKEGKKTEIRLEER